MWRMLLPVLLTVIATISAPMKLLDNADSVTWAPDGAMFAFVRWNSGTSADIVTVHANDLEPEWVLPEASRPFWSPDGSRIAFMRGDNLGGTASLYVVDAAGTPALLYADPSYFIADYSRLSWSPDGQRIVFSRSSWSPTTAVYSIDVNGGDPVNLSTSGEEQLGYVDMDPKWSPDGSSISFVSSRDNEYAIYIMDPDGDNQRRLIPAGDGVIWEWSAEWSPDGNQILINRGDIWTVNADGTDAVQLTNDPAGVGQAAWSPDGSKIAYVSDPTGAFADIYVMNRDGTHQTRVTDNYPDIDSEPVWSPDGKTLLVRCGEDIYSVSIPSILR